MKGIIAGISGDASSELWTLQFKDGSSARIRSGSGVRTLARVYGATEGTSDLIEKVKGKEIFYSVDEMGVMEGFTPVEEASEKDSMKGVGKSENGNFEVIGSAKGPDGQNALIVGCKVDMNEAKDELYDFLRKVKKKLAFKGFDGFIFKKQF